jgi:hypothetical protein
VCEGSVGQSTQGRHKQSRHARSATSWQIANVRHKVGDGVAQVVREACAEVSGGVVHVKSTAEKTQSRVQ